MRLVKVIVTTLVLLLIVVFCIDTILPFFLKSFSEFYVWPESNVWKIIFSLGQLTIAGYLVTKGIEFIIGKTGVPL